MVRAETTSICTAGIDTNPGVTNLWRMRQIWYIG